MVRFLLGASLVFVLVVPARGQITAADADFDRNGVVDFADFLLFVSVFGQTAPIDSPEGDRVALVALYHATDGITGDPTKVGFLMDRLIVGMAFASTLGA